MKKSIFEWVVSLLIGFVIAILLTTFVGSRYTVKGDSMYPTFKDGEELIVNKLSVPFHKLDRGDVVIFHATKKRDYIKRLIGKPGDEVKYYKDKLYVNGKYIKEPYLKTNKQKLQNFLLRTLMFRILKIRMVKIKFLKINT